MSYIALYRKYRPQTFRELKGQDHVSRTLRQALARGRLHHAYLFCGPRGTGKTSTAKILAKAINCRERKDGEPCNQCPSCRRITEGNAMDVLEIDAASNRGIDEIRDLRERVKLSPVESLYKVYIIDEVHMLTPEAFNALLKTLEEPPEHVVFVLATTEPRKIPPTILSRCQRFDFHQISVPVIIEQLREIAGAAGGKIEEEALYLIARQARGGLRDALSLLDQCLAAGDGKVTLQDVAGLIGAVADDFLLEFHQGVVKGEAGRCLVLLDRLLNAGKEPRQFLSDLILFYRNLVLIKLGGVAGELIALSPETKERYEEAAGQLSREQLMAAVKSLSQTEGEIRYTTQGRIFLEMGILQLLDAVKSQETEKELPAHKAIQEKQKAARREMAAAAETSLSPPSVQAEPVIRPARAATKKKSPPSAPAPADAVLDLNLIKAKWESFLEALKKASIMTYAFVVDEKPIAVEGSSLILAFKADHRFHKERCEMENNKKIIEQVLADVYGRKIELRCVLQEEQAPAKTDRVSEEDVLQSALDLFGGRLVEIKEEEL